MEHYLIIAMVIFFAALVQGIGGFGFALVSMPLLSLFLPVRQVTPLVTLSGVLVTTIIFISLKRHFDLSRIVPLALGALAGIPTGVYLLSRLDNSIIRKTLAVILFIYSCYALFFTTGRITLSRPWGYIFGFISGCLGGAINTNGPPVIIYASLQSWNKEDTTVTLQSFFLASGLVIIALHGAKGILTLQIFRYFIYSLPPLLLGVTMGILLYRRIDQSVFMKIIFTMLIILSIVLFSA